MTDKITLKVSRQHMVYILHMLTGQIIGEHVKTIELVEETSVMKAELTEGVWICLDT